MDSYFDDLIRRIDIATEKALASLNRCKTQDESINQLKLSISELLQKRRQDMLAEIEPLKKQCMIACSDRAQETVRSRVKAALASFEKSLALANQKLTRKKHGTHEMTFL